MQMDSNDLQFAIVVIAAEVKKLYVRGIVRRDEQEDLRSELMVRLLAEWGRFDPGRGALEAFVNRVVRTQLVSWLRARNAQKRSAAIHPIDAVAEPRADPDSWDGRQQLVSDLRIDLAEAEGLLSPLEKEIVDNLRREPLKQVAEQMGVPRRTLRDRKDRIREIYGICGVNEYLPKPPPRDGRFA